MQLQRFYGLSLPTSGDFALQVVPSYGYTFCQYTSHIAMQCATVHCFGFYIPRRWSSEQIANIYFLPVMCVVVNFPIRQFRRKLQQFSHAINCMNMRKPIFSQIHISVLFISKLNSLLQEREAEFEEEQERIRKEKEQEVARLRAMQERARDHQAEQDALRAKRNQVSFAT